MKHIYAQVIDDGKGQTLAAAGSNEKDIRGKGGNLEGAKIIGRTGCGSRQGKGSDQAWYLIAADISIMAG